MEERGSDQEVQISRAKRLQRNVHQHVQGELFALHMLSQEVLELCTDQSHVKFLLHL